VMRVNAQLIRGYAMEAYQHHAHMFVKTLNKSRDVQFQKAIILWKQGRLLQEGFGYTIPELNKALKRICQRANISDNPWFEIDNNNSLILHWLCCDSEYYVM